MPSARDLACARPGCAAFGVVGAGNIYRHGMTAAGEQRFRCVTCGGTFTATTGSVTQRFRHKKATVTQGAGLVLFRDWTVREAAEEVGVAPSTVAKWVKAAQSSPEFMTEIRRAMIAAAPGEVRTLVRLGRNLGFITAIEAETILGGNPDATRQLFFRLSAHLGPGALLAALQP